LKTNGKWHSKYGLYGDKGGYVAFWDGHVTWYDGSKPAQFLKWDQSGYTNNIQEAVPTSAFIGGGFQMATGLKDTDGAELITAHPGKGTD
jgi:prepilin-type processing-associated H-X9-DG protein